MAEPVEMEGACHCGTVRFRVRLPEGLKGTRCNCSFCRMRGAIAIGVPIADFTLLAGEDALTLYQFNTRVRRALFLLEMRHLHASPPALEPQPLRHQRRVP